MSLFQNYRGNVVRRGTRTKGQQTKFDRCMRSMHLWYGNANAQIWMLTQTPEYTKRRYAKRCW